MDLDGASVLKVSSLDLLITALTALVIASLVRRLIRSIIAHKMAQTNLPRPQARAHKVPDFFRGKSLAEMSASCPFMTMDEGDVTGDGCVLPSTSSEALDKVTPDALDDLSGHSTPGTKCPSESFNSLTEEEKAKERAVRAEQLAKIYQLMQEQPDRFGTVTFDDMEQQLTHYYTTTTDDTCPVVGS